MNARAGVIGSGCGAGLAGGAAFGPDAAGYATFVRLPWKTAAVLEARMRADGGR